MHIVVCRPLQGTPFLIDCALALQGTRRALRHERGSESLQWMFDQTPAVSLHVLDHRVWDARGDRVFWCVVGIDDVADVQNYIDWLEQTIIDGFAVVPERRAA
jgi:hypothetical protein